MRVLRSLKLHVIDPVSRTFTQFGLDDGYLLAAGVAYYVGLSLFPILWVLMGALGAILRVVDPGEDARAEVLRVVAVNASPEAAIQVGRVLDQLLQGGPPTGLISIAVVLFTAGTIFAQFERAFDRIWRFTPPEDLGWIATLKSLLVERITAFILLIGVGGVVVLTFVAATILESIQAFTSEFLPLPPVSWQIVQTVTTIAINTMAFGVLYHTMPRARVRWKEAFRGGLIVAIVWELGRRVLTALLIGERYNSYGVVGAMLAIQLWAYYAVTIVLLGAEYVRVTCKYCTGEAAAEMNRRRFWQLMSKMYARQPGTPATASPTAATTTNVPVKPQPSPPATSSTPSEPVKKT